MLIRFSDSTLQLIKKQPPVEEFHCSIKEDNQQLPKKVIKTCLPYWVIYVRLDFLHVLQPKQHINNRLTVEADTRIQPSSINQIKKISQFSHFFLFSKLFTFIKNVIYINMLWVYYFIKMFNMALISDMAHILIVFNMRKRHLRSTEIYA